MKLLKAAVIAAFFSSTAHGFGISTSKFVIGTVVHAITQVAKADRNGSIAFGNRRSSLPTKSNSAQ